MEHIALPRRLVNRLLAEAQHAPDGRTLGVVGAVAGIPTHCHTLAAGADPAAAERTLRAAGETLFAVYETHPQMPAGPDVAELARWDRPDLLYLPLCLDTRGVLEIRGFRLHAGRVCEVPLELAGPEDPAPGAGPHG